MLVKVSRPILIPLIGKFVIRIRQPNTESSVDNASKPRNKTAEMILPYISFMTWKCRYFVNQSKKLLKSYNFKQKEFQKVEIS